MSYQNLVEKKESPMFDLKKVVDNASIITVHKKGDYYVASYDSFVAKGETPEKALEAAYRKGKSS